MPLRIDVLKYRGHAVAEPESVVFDREGGTVGRSVDNKLVLADDCVSRKHARISFHGGRYYLTDESANGTLIFNRDILVHYDRIELEDGDILRIGDYDLGVTYEERIDNTHAVGVERIPSRSRFEDDQGRDRPSERDALEPPRKEGPAVSVKELSIDDFFRDTGEIPTPERSTDKKPPAAPEAPKQAPEVKLNERKVDSLFKDIDDFFRDSVVIETKDLAPEPEGEPEQRAVEKPQASGLPPVKTREHVDRTEVFMDEQPPIAAPAAPAPVVPPPVAPEPVVPRPVPPDQVPPVEAVAKPDVASTAAPAAAPPVEKPAHGGQEESGSEIQEIRTELLNLFLKGARIEDTGFVDGAEIPEFMETLGSVFRELVTGLFTVLKGRTEIKAEFRLAMTMVRPFRNNPLKLSPRIEDALKRLMKRDHPSFLEPVDAVREGFEDVMNHQLAMNAGIQASLAEALDRFDPQRFADKHKDASLFHTKGKCWKDYCDAYADLREQAAEGIFGKAFIQAYEDQLEKLRASQKKNQ